MEVPALVADGSVVPDAPELSSLFLSVRNGSMPPPGRPRPTEAERAVLRHWIECGAEDWCPVLDCSSDLEFEGTLPSEGIALGDAQVEGCLNDQCLTGALALPGQSSPDVLGEVVLQSEDRDSGWSFRYVVIQLLGRGTSKAIAASWRHTRAVRVGDVYRVTFRAADGNELFTLSRTVVAIDRVDESNARCPHTCPTPVLDSLEGE